MVKKEAGGQLAEVGKLVDKMLADAQSEPFRSPVLWKEWGLDDYPDVVKEPMDLGTVKSNLAAGKYADVDALCKDVRLVWSNCMAYNADKSEYYRLAKKFERQFERELGKIAKKQNGGETPAKGAGGAGGAGAAGTVRGTTAEERAAFCRTIYETNEVALGELIVALQKECPKALSKTPGSDDVEINVDAIDTASFRKVEALLKDLIAEESNKVTKARTAKEEPAATPGGDAAAAGGTAANGTPAQGKKRAADEEPADQQRAKRGK